jgi:hypothetical protein
VLLSAGRKALIVAVEMVDDDGVVEKDLGRTGTAGKTDHASQERHRGPALHRAAVRFSARYFRRQRSKQS